MRIRGKTGNYGIPRGIAAKCPECGAWLHVRPQGGNLMLPDYEAVDRFWAEHLQSCGWAPPARTILGWQAGLAPSALMQSRFGDRAPLDREYRE